MKSLPAALVLAALVSSPSFFAAGCSGSSLYDEMTGEQVYARLCAFCHGEDGRALKGTGESYLGKRKYWTEESLLEYIRNPAAYKKKAPHLKGTYMPPINGTISEEARQRLVGHVLELMDALEPAGR